jgi:hypothetical protein
MDEGNAPEGFLSIKRMAGFWPPDVGPLAVMAAGRTGPNNWWGECSVFIPKHLGRESKAYIHLTSGVSGTGLPINVDIVDSDYMRVELEQKAVQLLAAHFSAIASHTGLREFYALRYELLPGAKIDIYRLIDKGEFVSEIQALGAETKHGMLREYLWAIARFVTAKIESRPAGPGSFE